MSELETLLAGLRDLLARIEESGDHSCALEPAVLEAATDLAALLPGEDHATKTAAWETLGAVYWHRHVARARPGRTTDFRIAARMFEFVFCFAPDPLPAVPGELVPAVLRGSVVSARAKLGALQDLSAVERERYDDVVRILRRVLGATPAADCEFTQRCTELTIALFLRFQTFGEKADLDEAINVAQEAIASRPSVDGSMVDCLGLLASSLVHRYRISEVPTDLDRAIETYEALNNLAPDHPNLPAALTNLAIARQWRFDLRGNSADLEAATAVADDALAAASEDDPEFAAININRSNLLLKQYEQTGMTESAHDSVELANAAVNSSASDDPRRRTYLLSLQTHLYERFRRAGNTADLDEAVRLGRDAVGGRAANSLAQVVSASQTGLILLTRYELFGATADLEDALGVLRAAAASAPMADVSAEGIKWASLHAGCLANLGIGLHARYERFAEPTDLDEAIEVGLAAMDAVPVRGLDYAKYSANAAIALLDRAKSTSEMADLDRAVGLFREGLRAIPERNMDRFGIYSLLGTALQARAARSGSRADIDEAIACARIAVESGSEDTPYHVVYLRRFAESLYARFELLGRDADASEAFTLFARAAQTITAPPSTRIEAARSAGASFSTTRPRDVAELLEVAVGLLHKTAGRDLERSDRERLLDGPSVGLASDAAALILSTSEPGDPGQAARALRVLEAGRAIGQGLDLDTRSDLAQLGLMHPELAEQYRALTAELDREPPRWHVTGHATASASDPAGLSDPDGAPQGDYPADRRKLDTAFSALLEHIRALPGFASFARLPDIDMLLEQAAEGPVVTLNVSRHGSHALLLTEKGISALPLQELDYDAVLGHTAAFEAAIRAVKEPDELESERAREMIRTVQVWLWDAVVAPVLEALGFPAAAAADAAGPRLWWAPGGLLGSLPLQAAQSLDGEDSLLDRAVFSFTPTIRALHHIREQDRATRAALAALTGEEGKGPTRSLFIGMSTTPAPPGQETAYEPLLSVARERNAFTSAFPLSWVLEADSVDLAGDRGPAPTHAAVRNLLPECAIVHFACHGVHDASNPSRSQLVLFDHATAPFTVRHVARLRLSGAQLAYLSACRTAYQGTRLPDESIHLASTFVLAGFSHVIAAQWEVNDLTAALIAEDVYTFLKDRGDGVDMSRSAEALNRALRAQRRKWPRNAALWAAFVHAGA